MGSLRSWTNLALNRYRYQIPGMGLVDGAGTAALRERDDRSGFVSNFYAAGRPLAPIYVHYEIAAVIDGVLVTFSDDPARGVPARFGTAPIHVEWQSATLDGNSNSVRPASISPWRTAVGEFGSDSIATDRKNAYRFRIHIDHSLGQTVELERVTVKTRQ